MRLWLLCAAAPLLCAQDSPAPPATFGTAVVIPSGLEGQVYHLRDNTTRLPDFEKLRPAGVIYTASLDVASRDFMEGFPGVTERLEFFAIDYSGRFWIEKPGVYLFVLASDDGARLWIDGRVLADNDGLHPEKIAFGRVKLAGGIHRIRVSYFQGPRYHVALRLQVAGVDEPLRIFSTEEFKPPPNPESWRFPDTSR